MIRMYEHNLSRGWKAYLKVYSAHRLRDYIIKKVLMHQKRMYFNVVLNAWNAHACKSRLDEKNGYLTTTNLQIQEQLNLMQKN